MADAQAVCCRKSQAQFAGLRVGNSTFTAFIDAFTSNTYVLMVTSDPAIGAWRYFQLKLSLCNCWLIAAEEATLLNIALARKHFEKLISDI
jgi:Ras-related GTP-binding protein A/B